MEDKLIKQHYALTHMKIPRYKLDRAVKEGEIERIEKQETAKGVYYKLKDLQKLIK